MALIPKVGRKSLKMRLVIAMLYILLTAGAITMVYPFLLMLSSSITSSADVNRYSVIPRYLLSDEALFPKYAEMRYNNDIDIINQSYGTDFSRIEDVTAPRVSIGPKETRLVRDWQRFLADLPDNFKQACFQPYMGAPSKLEDRYREFCKRRFKNDISKLNKLYIEENVNFEVLGLPFERYKMREWEPDDSPKMSDWIEFRRHLPVTWMRPILIDPAYQIFLRDTVYEGSIKRLNKAWGTRYRKFQDIVFPPVKPIQHAQAADWTRFVRECLPFRYMKIAPEAVRAYREFLEDRYKTIVALNLRYNSSYDSFEDISLPSSLYRGGSPLVDWMDFVAQRLPVKYVRAINCENLYREHLRKRFGTVAAANAAFGTRWESFDVARCPIYLADWHYVKTHAGELRREYVGRNFVYVTKYVMLHGGAIANTVIFVLAVVLTHLIVNPLCAYALSRYNLPYAYKVLLFLLATMAFPAEVAMIPSFLLLKQFNLLNTYWALILPGMANGYAIFLLKGFFDSLPKELYEAGIIDGAGEGTMFRKITLPMSKPIFAVIALQAFTGAYGAFMYAMLVCQDSKMWTLMVWLYELQMKVPQYVTMAALTMAAIPTLFVFIFAQNVIMRGIIIPSYK